MDWLEIYTKLPIGVLVINAADTKIEAANAYAATLLGITATALENSFFSDIFPKTALSTKTSVIIDVKRTDNSVVSLQLSFTDFENNRIALYLKEAHSWMDNLSAVQDKDSRLQAIINTAVDGIITINEHGIVESVNPAAARLFGYTPEEVIGRNINILMPEPHHSDHDNYLHNYQSTKIRKIIGIGREVPAKRKDGIIFPIHLSISEVKLNDRIIYTGILHDLSAQKEAEEQIKRYAIELERSNRELQDFAYVSSHDLQEPLRKIRAFGDRLKSKEASNLTEKSVDYLNRMVNAAERMQILINDLLSFSRVSTHAKKFELVDLNEILKGVLSDLEYAIEESHAIIEAERLPIVEAEPFQMRQLFQNLIGNALKFRKLDIKPYIKIYTRIVPRQVHASPGDTLTKIIVEDNGIGFDEQYKDKIFQIFQRLEGRKFEGSGIGLSICKRIATRHGGDIEASSEVDKGATFIVTLPSKQKYLDHIHLT